MRIQHTATAMFRWNMIDANDYIKIKMTSNPKPNYLS
jgi:hypothetical protein